ncbi:DUF2970 domain-containing protein [Halomonas sp. Bachu 37]|uniref:DUF2970 domain-containing protein n=1 Tax=Halomonas kashgarensis TaxID=3084920 RepID=UPI003217B68C
MWAVVKSVLAAFLGVQNDRQRQVDFSSTSPWSFILVAIVLAALMVMGLIWLANAMASH